MTALCIVHSVCRCGRVSFKQRSREEEDQNQQCLQQHCLFFRQQASISPLSISQQINEGGKGERNSVNKSEINSHSASWSCRQVIKGLLSSIFDLHQGFFILSNFFLCLDRWVGCTAAISTQPFSAGILIGIPAHGFLLGLATFTLNRTHKALQKTQHL